MPKKRRPLPPIAIIAVGTPAEREQAIKNAIIKALKEGTAPEEDLDRYKKSEEDERDNECNNLPQGVN